MAHTQQSAVQHVTEATFDVRVARATGAVLVEFTAQWCPPCRVLAPVLEEFAREQADTLSVFACDADINTTLAARYGVLGLPTLILFKDGQPVKQIIGARPKAALLREFAPFLG